MASGSDIAAAVMAASSSGVLIRVPGLSFGIAFDLSLVGLAQADDAPSFGAIHKGHVKQTQPETQPDLANGGHARFAILVPDIGPHHRRFPFQFGGQRRSEEHTSELQSQLNL